MAAKRFYYIKMKQDFFNSKEIKRLRKMAGGDTFTIIYLKLLLISAPTKGVIYYDGICDDPAEELALEIDEDVDNINVTLNFLKKINAIEQVNENGESGIYLNEIKTMISSESESAERVREHRRKKGLINQKALQCNTNVTESNDSETKSNPILDIDIDKDIDKEIDIHTVCVTVDNSVENILLNYLESKITKPEETKTQIKSLLKIYAEETLILATKRYIKRVVSANWSGQYIKEAHNFFTADNIEYYKAADYLDKAGVVNGIA